MIFTIRALQFVFVFSKLFCFNFFSIKKETSGVFKQFHFWVGHNNVPTNAGKKTTTSKHMDINDTRF